MWWSDEPEDFAEDEDEDGDEVESEFTFDPVWLVACSETLGSEPRSIEELAEAPLHPAFNWRLALLRVSTRPRCSAPRRVVERKRTSRVPRRRQARRSRAPSASKPRPRSPSVLARAVAR